MPSGPGLIIGDPVAGDAATSADAIAFGAGCTRWLQLELSDHLELGKMPAWSEFREAASAVRWVRGGVPQADRENIARTTGVTYIVVSQIRGTVDHAVLTLELAWLSENHFNHDPFTISGSFKAITAGLPGTARSLLKQLGVSTDGVTDNLEVQPDDLLYCGRAPLNENTPLPAGLGQSLRVAAYRTPLAALVSVRRTNVAVSTNHVRHLAKSQSLPVREFLQRARPDLADPLPERLSGAVQGAAPNYLLARLQAARDRRERKYESAVLSAERAVRSAPLNPHSWRLLFQTVEDHSQSIRRGRFAGNISESEWKVLNKLYARSHAVATHYAGMARGKMRASALVDLANAGLTYGGVGRAREALWRAQTLAPDLPAVYFIGLEMFQPKWGGDPDDLSRIMKLAVATPQRMQKLAPFVLHVLAVTAFQVPDAEKISDTIYRGLVIHQRGWFATVPETREALQEKWQQVHARPRDPKAWRAWGEALNAAALRWRGDRYRHELSEAESDALMMLYDFWQLAAARWCDLEPENARAWLNLSIAASKARTG